MDVLKTVKSFIKQENLLPSGASVLLAVSGGLDSMTLADIMLRLAPQLTLNLAVASFDHGLRPTSRADLEFVAAWAEAHGLPFYGGHQDIQALCGGKNVEDVARRERYAFLRTAAIRSSADVIATAHHRDDQAETVLLHLLRGSGVTGLAGIRPAREGLIRPLLCLSRAEIAAYAAERGIAYREDETNASTVYLRNRIRLELLPYLSGYNPSISEQLNCTAAICRDEDAFLEEMAEFSFAELWSTEDAALNGPGFDRLAPAVQRRVLRKAYQLLAGDAPELSFAHVEAIRSLADEQSCDLPHGFKAWRRCHIYLGRHQPPLAECDRQWPLVCDGAWHSLSPLGHSYCAVVLEQPPMQIEPSDGNECCIMLPLAAVDAAYWRTRRDGDWLASRGAKGRRKVKEVFIDAHIPVWLRCRWPLLIGKNGETLWLPGLKAGLCPNAADHQANIVLIKVRFSDTINVTDYLDHK